MRRLLTAPEQRARLLAYRLTVENGAVRIVPTVYVTRDVRVTRTFHRGGRCSTY